MLKLCVIYNFAQKYRTSIFKKIDEEFDCHWIFGDNLTDIKGMDTSLLKSVKHIKNVTFIKKPLYYQVGAVKYALFGPHNIILMLSESTAISTYVIALLKCIVAPKKKLYFWSHGLYGKESWIKRFIYKIRFGSADGIFLYGNYAKDLMIKNGYNPSKLFVIHNSLDHQSQLYLRSQLKREGIYSEYFKNNDPVLIFIGRLTSIKKLDMLINAVNFLANRGENYNVVFIGDGEKRKDLENQVYQLGLQSKFWFFGESYDDKINAQLIYEADLCVAPGNVGLTAMHTMVFGTPVITHDNWKKQMPEFEAIRGGRTGNFFTYNSELSLANCISDWFKEHRDDRERIRALCYNEIDQFWTPEYQIKIFKTHLK